MQPILVFGHRNPDNDSICSAVAYAHLKNHVDSDNVYLPARLGPMPPETSWVFDRFGVAEPDLVKHVHTRARDVMTSDPVTVLPECSVLEAGQLMRTHGVRALPVVQADGLACGLVNVRVLAERYIAKTGMTSSLAEMPVAAGKIADVFGGTLLLGDRERKIGGDVLIGAMELETMRGHLKPGDMLIVGNREHTQPIALKAGIACLVVTGGAQPEDGVLELAEKLGAVVISSPLDTYATARLVDLSHPVSDIMDAKPLFVLPDALLSEAAEDLVDSPHREAIVVDDDGHLLGLLTRTSIARGYRRRVILVDHNELSQSAPGVDEAQVVEIVDHHRVGDVQTAAPIMFLDMPVGSTATIVAQRYRELGVQLPVPMAGLLLAAVLSDTVLLKSPTTTDVDRRIVESLGVVVGADPLEFGLEMFKARSVIEEFVARRVVNADLKEYRVGDTVVAIGQVETVDANGMLDAHRAELEAVMRELLEMRGYGLVLLMVTDVVREGSAILAEGRRRVAERGLGIDLSQGIAWMDGVLSRKKQVAARLLEAAGA